MSGENVEIVRSIFAAWEHGDFSHAEWAHSEIGLVVADGPTPGSWTGIAAMAATFRETLRPLRSCASRPTSTAPRRRTTRSD